MQIHSLLPKAFLFQAIQFSQTVLIQTTPFSISTQIEPNPVQPFRNRVDLGAMAIKGYSEFPKSPASLESHHEIVLCQWVWGVLSLCRVAFFYIK